MIVLRQLVETCHGFCGALLLPLLSLFVYVDLYLQHILYTVHIWVGQKCHRKYWSRNTLIYSSGECDRLQSLVLDDCCFTALGIQWNAAILTMASLCVTKMSQKPPITCRSPKPGLQNLQALRSTVWHIFVSKSEKMKLIKLRSSVSCAILCRNNILLTNLWEQHSTCMQCHTKLEGMKWMQLEEEFTHKLPFCSLWLRK